MEESKVSKVIEQFKGINVSSTSNTKVSGEKITFFSATDEPPVTVEEFVPDFIIPSSSQEGLDSLFEAGFAEGSVNRILFNGPGFSLYYIWVKSENTLPVHTHNADCLYYVISGEAIMGNRTLKAGDGFLVPANTYYSYTAGPEGVEVLEIRQVNQTDIRFRDSKPEYWAKLAENVASRREIWKTEKPPVRESTGLG